MAETGAVARFPFVSKAEILRVYRPGVEPSDRTFRTLRQHGLVSAGVVIRHRRRGKVLGQLRCYAALNIDAALLARHDRTEEAVLAAGKAARFETDWQPLVAKLAAQFNLHDFEAFRAARNLLAHGLAPATEELERLHVELGAAVRSVVREEFVRIGEITGQWAALQVLTPELASKLRETVSPINATVAALIAKSIPPIDPSITSAIAKALEPLSLETRRVAVDSFLVRASRLGPGELALLRIEHSAGSSFLSLLAAIEERDFFELDADVAPYFSDEPLPGALLDHIEHLRSEGKAIGVGPLFVPLAS